MSRSYSVYDAKTHFSELLRRVRAGQRIVISMRGEAIAEIRPIEPPASGLEARIAELTRQGIIAPAANPRAPMSPLVRKRGALARFLRDRD